jgi:hypothetical protein
MKDEMDKECRTHGRNKRFMKYFDRKTWTEESLGRPRRRWEENIRMDLRGRG